MVRKKKKKKKFAFGSMLRNQLDGCFKCNFYERDFARDISRIKSHWARVKDHDIDICIKAYLAI